MKFKTTRNEINNHYSFVIRVGYCDAQNLLQYDSPIAYNSGVYGWNCDVYDCGKYDLAGTAVVTGYRPFGEEGYTDIIREYDKKAKAIYESAPWQERKEAIEKNTCECLEKCLARKREKMLK